LGFYEEIVGSNIDVRGDFNENSERKEESWKEGLYLTKW
jgi:hypothetical protein